MRLSTNDNQLSTDNCCDLYSVLTVMPSARNRRSSSRYSSNGHPQLSFEDPFEDPNLEPLPLEPQGSLNDKISLFPSMIELSTFITRDSCLPLIFNAPKVPADDTNLRIDLRDLAVGCKRSLEEAVFSNPQDDCFRTIKRQRTCHFQAAIASGRKNMARFRPYQEKQWGAMFQKLIQFKLEYGSCCVPYSYPEDPTLARWVKRQRYQYKKFNDGDAASTMTTRRIEELESLGFVWHSHSAAWQEKLNELKAFKRQTEHCNVPSTYPENVSLSTWVKCQRRQYKLFVSGAASSMTLERFQVLESMGFVFEPQQNRSRNIVF